MSGGDPKVVARLAAQIARELKEAMREHGAVSAAGTMGNGATASNPEAPASAVSPAQVGAGSADGTTVLANTEAQVTSPERAAPAPAEEDQAASDRAKPDEARVRELFDQTAAWDADAATAKEQREVINAIKTLSKQIKALFEHAKKQAEQDQGSDPDLAQDGMAVGEATRETEKVVQDLESGVQTAGKDAGAGTDLSPVGGIAALPVGNLASAVA